MKIEKKEVEQKKNSKLAIASFVLGLVSLISIVSPYLLSLFESLDFRILAIIFAILYMVFGFGSPFILIITIILSVTVFLKIHKNPKLKGRLLAVLGVIFSLLSLVLNYLMLKWGVG